MGGKYTTCEWLWDTKRLAYVNPSMRFVFSLWERFFFVVLTHCHMSLGTRLPGDNGAGTA